jgi:hypothetical protein
MHLVSWQVWARSFSRYSVGVTPGMYVEELSLGTFFFFFSWFFAHICYCCECRATSIFITFCLVAAIVLYVTPFQVVAVLLGVYTLRHPRFRDPLPSVPLNFFKRLPSQADRIL